MSVKRIGIFFIGLLALASIALVLLIRRHSTTTTTPVTVRKPQPPGGVFDYEIVAEYPHDTEAYTQGLIYLDGFLYESTGITGRSTLRRVRLETGEVIQQRAINPADYAEGLTEWRGSLLLLTPRKRGNSPPWHVRKLIEDLKRHFGNNIGLRYDIASFEARSIFEYPGDAWGLTHDENRIIMSDGSAELRFLEPETFAELSRLKVFDGNEPVAYLNELEFVDGKIYANVQRQDRIAIIQPDSGQVTGWIDLAGLKPQSPQLPSEPLRPALNGIAYDAAGRRLFVTGKFWPKVYQIRLKPLAPATQ